MNYFFKRGLWIWVLEAWAPYRAMSGKWLWKFTTKNASFCWRMIVGKYGETLRKAWRDTEKLVSQRESKSLSDKSSTKIHYEGSQGILFVMPSLLLGNCCWIKFWHDPCVGIETLERLFPMLFSIALYSEEWALVAHVA